MSNQFQPVLFQKIFHFLVEFFQLLVEYAFLDIISGRFEVAIHPTDSELFHFISPER